MDLLVIGIDGGTKEIIEGMPMPFTQSLFKGANHKVLSEDPYSRGWAEILTGCHGSVTKGFYLMPFLDGTYDFNRGYTKNDMVSASPNPPLWTMLNEGGAKVGIMNVPTTGPAPEVNGFMVAGGGGGLSSIGGVPKGMYYPDSVEALLESNRYTFDIRLPGGSTTVLISDTIKKIGEAEKVQKDTYIELVKEHTPDFGFFCIRMITEIQYLARYDIEQCMRGFTLANKNGEEFVPETEIQELIIEYYKKVDEHIEALFKAIEPKEFLFVGDHSTALFKKDLNLDVWLESNGFLKRCNRFMCYARKAVDLPQVTKLINMFGIKRRFQTRPTRGPLTKFKASKTEAFGTFFETGNFAGIYVNDSIRFKGPVDNQQDIDTLVDLICKKYNSDPQNAENSLVAVPYRRNYDGAPYQDMMPDIQIKKPDTTFCSSRKWQYIRNNSNLEPLNDSLEHVFFPHTGLKGTDPVFVYSKGLEAHIASQDSTDLTLAYKLIQSYFDKSAATAE